MLLIGVTGGIGAGKTTALQAFRRLGARVLEADSIVHSLYARGTSVYDALSRRWGRAVVADDMSIDRAAVARVVFGSRRELAWLNQLVHPLVRQRIVFLGLHPFP